jgi:hypothetical protein
MICHVEVDIGPERSNWNDEWLIVDVKVRFLDGPLEGCEEEFEVNAVDLEGRI